MKKKSAIREWIQALIVALITVMFVRGFLFEAYTIPTSSMEETLKTGDFILVNKFTYGARLPITPITFPFTHQTFPFTDIKSYSTLFQFNYHRLPGTSSIKRNDVVVFNYPMETTIPVDHRIHYVKRCVALPGDKLEIKDGEIYINDSIEIRPVESQHNYIVRTQKKGLHPDTLEKFDITEGGMISAKGDYMFALTKEKANQLKKQNAVVEIKPYIEKKGAYSEYIFPHHKNYSWNSDNLGPFTIPRKGDTIEVNLNTLPLYERILSVYEENIIAIKHDSVFINGKSATNYILKMNYYFMMGDNRHNSADSRFWGFVPEDHITGKAVSVLFSIDKEASLFNKIKWNRCFKSIE